MKRLLRAAAFLGAALVLAGAALSARALVVRAKASAARVLIARAWSETLRTGRAVRPWPWADSHPVARLLIPSVHYREVVLEGASPRVLAFGPARMAAGARPGEAGNLLLTGHRTSWFLPLRDVRTGATVDLEWRDSRGPRRRAYRVTEIRVIEPGDISFLAPTAHDALTLITCYPFGSRPGSPLRYVVRAEAEGLSTALDTSGRFLKAWR